MIQKGHPGPSNDRNWRNTISSRKEKKGPGTFFSSSTLSKPPNVQEGPRGKVMQSRQSDTHSPFSAHTSTHGQPGTAPRSRGDGGLKGTLPAERAAERQVCGAPGRAAAATREKPAPCHWPRGNSLWTLHEFLNQTFVGFSVCLSIKGDFVRRAVVFWPQRHRVRFQGRACEQFETCCSTSEMKHYF